MKIIYAEEALADILEAVAYLNERNPAAASSLDTDLAACIEHSAQDRLVTAVRAMP